MKHWTRIPVGFLAGTLMFAFAGKALAQEKAKADKPTAMAAQEKIAPPGPVLFENDKVRVTETRIKPGERNEMKMRNDRVNVYITPAKQRVHYGDGRTEDFNQEAGSIRVNKAGISSTENIGTTESHSVIVNLK